MCASGVNTCWQACAHRSCLGLLEGSACWCAGFAGEEAGTGSNSEYQDQPGSCRQELSRDERTCAERTAAAASVCSWACFEVPCLINVKLWAAHGTGWRSHTSLEIWWASEQQHIAYHSVVHVMLITLVPADIASY